LAKITGILCQVITGNRSNAGTDGSVYLGLGGREFRLDSSADDYERGSWREYVLGQGPIEPNLPPPQVRVLHRDENDPRLRLPLDTDHLNRTPVYIRFEPNTADDTWNLAFATALVYVQQQFLVAFLPPSGFEHLWLGKTTGKILYLTDQIRYSDQPIFTMARDLSEKLKATPE
jgi:hypothetical protein